MASFIVFSKAMLVLLMGMNAAFVDALATPMHFPSDAASVTEPVSSPMRDASERLPASPGRDTPPADLHLSVPVRLRIPKIGLNAMIEQTGLTPRWAMGVPKKLENVAWFHLWPRPWEKGTAVIDWHFGWKKGIPAVFNHLHKLAPGDRFSIQDSEGITRTFVVKKSRTYKRDEDAPEIFSSSDGWSHLNVITCQGSWDRSQKTYSDRLVLFTDLVR